MMSPAKPLPLVLARSGHRTIAGEVIAMFGRSAGSGFATSPWSQ
jgi:hypothetical protein